MLDAGVAEPVYQPFAEQVGLVCRRGRGTVGQVKPLDSQAVWSLFKRNWGSIEPNTMGATW